MQRIHVLGNKRRCYSRHLHPIRVFKNDLLDAGLDVRYFSSPLDRGVDECDVLVFLEASYREILPTVSMERRAALEYLETFFEKFSSVVWFDDHDSSGMLRTYIFPHIKLYAKSQLMSNTEYYQEEHLSGILHRDFVHEQYGIQDDMVFKGPISDENRKKLRISWNLAMSNWGYRNAYYEKLDGIIQKNRKDYRVDYSKPNLLSRKNKISYRVNIWHEVPTLRWWRNRTRGELEKAKECIPHFDMWADGVLSKRRYIEELRSSIVIPSPFGIGEICYRDFESFFCGSVLLKPKMDHLRTWPDLYVDGETYVSHEWDFCDFIDKLTSILSNPAKYEDIAAEGQRRFREALSDGKVFAAHFKTMLTDNQLASI